MTKPNPPASSVPPPVSHMPVADDRISRTDKLAQYAAELTDEEVAKVGRIVAQLVHKYGKRLNNADTLEALRDEALTRLASEMNILATLDPAPCFHGEPPTIEIIGKMPGDSFHEHGFDHEKKRWEVLEANKRNEAYRGQKEKYKG